MNDGTQLIHEIHQLLINEGFETLTCLRTQLF